MKNSIETELDNLRKEVWSLIKNKIASIESALDNIDPETLANLNTALEEFSNVSSQVDSLSTSVNTLSKDYDTLNSSVTQQTNNINSINSTLSSNNQSIENLKTLVNSNSENISSLSSNKVDKIEGKTLSSNDFTAAEKTKLHGIEAGANKYVLPSEVVKDANYKHTDNNYTNAEKTKLQGIEAGANKYVLPNNVAMKDQIPTLLSQLSADETHQTVSTSEKQTWNNKVSSSDLATVAKTGSYLDLSNRPNFTMVYSNGALDITIEEV